MKDLKKYPKFGNVPNMENLDIKALKKCPKCNNIMALRTLLINSKKTRVVQCFVCRYWEPFISEDSSYPS